MPFVSTVQGVRDEIADRLNEVESDNTDRYTRYANLGLVDLFNSVPDSTILHASADRTLSSGTRIYTLPSDYQKMNFITDPSNGRTIRYLDPEQASIIFPSAYQGTVTNYTIHQAATSAYIEYLPTPNSGITVHQDYQKAIPTVSTGSASPQIPEKWYGLLCDYGEYRGLIKRGLRDEAATVFAKYEEDKAKFIADLRAKTTEIDRMRQQREFNQQSATSDPAVNIFNSA